MSKQYYHADTYTTHNSVGYLVKRAHGLSLDSLEPGLAEHGLTFTQYAVLMALRDGIALTTAAKVAFFEEMVELAVRFGARDRLVEVETRGDRVAGQ